MNRLAAKSPNSTWITIYKSVPSTKPNKPLPKPPLIGAGQGGSPITIPNQNPYFHRYIMGSFVLVLYFSLF